MHITWIDKRWQNNLKQVREGGGEGETGKNRTSVDCRIL